MRLLTQNAFNFVDLAAYDSGVQVGAFNLRMPVQEPHGGMNRHAVCRTASNVMVRASVVNETHDQLRWRIQRFRLYSRPAL